jgi:hypothetical protein
MQLRSAFRPTQAMIHENENVQFRRSRLSGGLYVLKLQLRSQWALLRNFRRLILGFEDVVESKLSLTSICFDYVLH